MNKNCKTCGWARQIANIQTIWECGCPLSGAYQTHVIAVESCDRWKKAHDEYLRAIGEIR